MFDDWQARAVYLLMVEVPGLLQLALLSAVFIRDNWRPAECLQDTDSPSSDRLHTTRSSTKSTVWSRKR